MPAQTRFLETSLPGGGTHRKRHYQHDSIVTFFFLNFWKVQRDFRRDKLKARIYVQDAYKPLVAYFALGGLPRLPFRVIANRHSRLSLAQYSQGYVFVEEEFLCKDKEL